MKTHTLALLLCLGFSNMAQAELKPVICRDTAEILKALEEFHETVVFTGVDHEGRTQYIVTVNPKDGGFTLVQFNEYTACILGIGNNAKTFELPDSKKPDTKS